MLPPYVVEEYDGKFWVHKQRKYNVESDSFIKGELAYNKSFGTYGEAQKKANKLVLRTGKLW